MKKSLASKLAVFIVVLAVALSCVALSAFAVSSTASLSLSSAVNDSNEVEVVLTLSKGVKLSTIQAEISYDKDVVTYKGSEYLAGQQNATNGDAKGIVLINDIWKESTPENASTDIVKLTFTINENVSAKDANFKLTRVTATDDTDAAITFASATPSTKVVVTATPTTTAKGDDGNGSGNGGNANGNSPATAGTIAASLAGVAVAATAAAVAVIVIKKKNKAE